MQDAAAADPPSAGSAPGAPPGVPTARRVRFEFPDDLDPLWNRLHPEVSFAADAVSLLMPHVEPYVIRSVRRAVPALDAGHRRTVEAFVAQEAAHQAQHRRFNDLVVARFRALGPVQRWSAWSCRQLERFGSARFSLAFAAAFETIAYSVARWSETHHREVFAGGDEVVVTLFMWHLAEEVEHKCVVFDLLGPCGVGRPLRALAAAAAVVHLSWFTLVATLVMMLRSGRALSPVAWWRLARLSLSLAFEVLGDLVMSLSPGHDPRSRTDPVLLRTWLAQADPEAATIPLWPQGPPVTPRG